MEELPNQPLINFLHKLLQSPHLIPNQDLKV